LAMTVPSGPVTGRLPDRYRKRYGQTDAAPSPHGLTSCPSLGGCAQGSRTFGRIKSMSEPTGKYSITMPRDIAEAARARSGPSGLSGYVAAAVARQVERDNLNELIAVAEAEHGPITEEEVRARREELQRARAEQGHPRSGAA
jgi:hypothetical protein